MMITYYPDGSWDTEHSGIAPEFTSEEIDRMWVELRAKNVKDETIKTIRDLLQFMINTEEVDGEEYYNENCDGDCRHCDYRGDCDEEYSDPCDDEDEDEEQYDEPAEDTETIEPAITCERCEYYCAGFSCSKSIKKKKGCGM